MLLKDKIALVTGSAQNICLAIASAFTREGAKSSSIRDMRPTRRDRR